MTLGYERIDSERCHQSVKEGSSPFLPASKEKLKKESPELYALLVKYDIIQKT
jgi:hypothetical protein